MSKNQNIKSVKVYKCEACDNGYPCILTVVTGPFGYVVEPEHCPMSSEGDFDYYEADDEPDWREV